MLLLINLIKKEKLDNDFFFRFALQFSGLLHFLIMTHINFVWMIDFDHFPWAVSDMIRRSVGSVEALPGGTSSPSIYLGHKWARTIQRRRKRSKRIYRM